MRHHYTPIFRRVLTSRLWSKPPAWRCVWLYMSLAADPEGFVPADISGLAIGANVSVTEVREAIAFLTSEDPDVDPEEDPNRGVVLAKVKGGWQVVEHVGHRELARSEAQKARNRQYMRRFRAAQKNLPDAPEESTEHPHVEVVDQPRTQTVTVTIPSEADGDPPTPANDWGSVEPTSTSVVLRRIPETWAPSDELRAAAVMAGVQRFDEHIARLRLGPIGGTRGVFPEKLDAYIEGMFGKLRTWEETDRAKMAPPSSATGAPRGFQNPRVPVTPLEPQAKHEAFARRLGLDLASLVRGVLEDHPQSSGVVSRLEILGERLVVAAKQKAAGHAITGKQTRAERRAWGEPPKGGNIPEAPEAAA